MNPASEPDRLPPPVPAPGYGPVLLKDRPIVGISACCAGCAVRYNGKSLDVLKALGREKMDFIWQPVCPECMAGLGVPRDPVHVVGESGAAVWTGAAEVKGRGGRKVGPQMMEGCRACLDALRRSGTRAFVYMDGSPSCGVYRTTLKDRKRGHPPGVFGSLLFDEGYFLVPAADLQSPVRWWDWKRRLLAFLWLADAPLSTRAELYGVWHRLKFLAQELDDPWARSTGRQLAAISVHPGTPEWDREVRTFRTEMMDRLRRPSRPPRILNSFRKHYGYLRKRTGRPVPQVLPPEEARSWTRLVQEMGALERAAAAEGLLFGASPVLYLGRRRISPEAPEPDPTPSDIPLPEIGGSDDA